jgi:lipopolysaccharide transport system ATP-binding protein
MSNTAIKIENLSKIYRLGEIGTGTISRDLERWFKTQVLKQEDPFLTIGETNDRTKTGASDIVYSLRDVNLEINQGDAVGIVGRNGAGKSTLLKILSRVTTPSTGRINIKGRVASLLEVGTGFHPELTGRENIYLNGAILGMRKREIDRKLDEIIDFSGVDRYVDTPVKRYSSGMYVRLAFAVAAHLESEILIVDEVLAVGDAEFQKKCLGKMGEVSKGEGRTVLFVSHNMGSVNALCNKGFVLSNGTVSFGGDIRLAVDHYINSKIGQASTVEVLSTYPRRYGSKDAKVKRVSLFGADGMHKSEFSFGEPIKMSTLFEMISPIPDLTVRFVISDSSGLDLFSVSEFGANGYEFNQYEKGMYEFSSTLSTVLLPGTFTISIQLLTQNGTPLDWIEHVMNFRVLEFSSISNLYYPWMIVSGGAELSNQSHLNVVNNQSPIL